MKKAWEVRAERVTKVNKGPESGEYKRFGDSLREHRESFGLTQTQAAEGLGMSGKSVSIISKWEHGHILPRIDILIKIAIFYDVAIEDLLMPIQEQVRREVGEE